MAGPSISRRHFLATSTLAMGAGMINAKAWGANDRIRLGLIGTGDRCKAHIGDLAKLRESQNVEVVAVCDVWKPNREAAAVRVEKLFDRKPFQTSRFPELLAQKEVDAVLIATPDFAHMPITIEALKAGKDVYVEKPMALTVEEANEALDLARQLDRVVQVGTQMRSEGRWQAAKQVRESGELGPITRVTAANCFNSARWARDYDDCKLEDVDWDAYLLNRPKLDFDPKLLRRWQLYKMCTNGMSGLWMAHLVDAAHKVMDAAYPTSAVALGGTYLWKDGREHTDNFHAILDYPEGFLFDWAMSITNSFPTYYTVHGRYGTMDLEKRTWSGDGGEVGHTVTGGKLDTVPDDNHMANWLQCIRSRQRPTADIAYGHQHAIATIMAATALETGQRMRYDKDQRKIYAG